MTRFVAEITLRTDPFEADTKEQAVMHITKNTYAITRLGAQIHIGTKAHLVEVVVTEHEDTDP